jgi:asparagine synthase (glutamine-hydrolysing)
MFSQDKRYVIVFNGEIYNYQDLRSQLPDYHFSSSSDTEVLLAAYSRWGSSCLNKLNGIFAFAIWDNRLKKLFLARDHVGVKPLYYYLKNDQLIFSSEIKAILEHPVPRKLNQRAFSNYLRVKYTPEPDTLIQDINKLPPASFAEFEHGVLTIAKYWQPNINIDRTLSAKESAYKTGQIITTAIKRQMVSDRPLGIFLSGGIDSGIILHTAAQINPEINTFSAGLNFASKELNELYNTDLILARQSAVLRGTHHHEITISEDDVLNTFESCVWHMDEPVANAVIISTYALAKLAKKHVAVVLDGSGGDELFGGYPRYLWARRMQYFQKLPMQLRSVLANYWDGFKKLNTPSEIDRFALHMFQKNHQLEKVIHPSFYSDTGAHDFFGTFFSERFQAHSYVDKLMIHDFEKWLVDESLLRSDKMSMAHGLETRVPLLDREVIALAHQIPAHHKTGLFQTKKILRRSFKKALPDYVVKLKKHGFFSPAAKIMRQPKIKEMMNICLDENYHEPLKDLFIWDTVKPMLRDHQNAVRNYDNILWTIFTFQIWAKRFNVTL